MKNLKSEVKENVRRILIIGIVVVAVTIVSVVFAYKILNDNPKINLLTSDIAVKQNTSSYTVKISAKIPYDEPYLYDCIIKIKYLTTSNTWKTASYDFGLMMHDDYRTAYITLDNDFKSGNPYLKNDGYFHGDVEPNIQIVEAYGFRKQ